MQCSTYIATDLDYDALGMAKTNLAMNGAADHFVTAKLRWGDDEGAKLLGSFDVVFGADIIYPGSLVALRDLLSTVDLLLAEGGMFVCGFVERDWTETMAALIDSCNELNFKIICLEAASAEDDKEYTTMGSRVLSIRRMNEGESNEGLGGDDCKCFPQLNSRMREREDDSSESEFEFPGFIDEEYSS